MMAAICNVLILRSLTRKNVISINITMVTAHFLVKLGEIKTLHHGVRDLTPHGVRNLANLNICHGVRAQIL